MRRTTSGWLAGVLVAGGALTLPGAAAAEPPDPSAHVPVWDHGPGGVRYVSLGDSFVSGPGIDPMRPEKAFCARSEKNFPTLVASELEAASFTDASCGGAVLADLTEPQVRPGGTNAAQLDAVGPDTTLVTLGTIGGNDVGLVGLAQECMFGPDCVDDSPDNPYAQRVEATREPLAAAIREVQERAPQADVVVVGYSVYLPYDGCPALSSIITPQEAAYFQGMVDRLSDVMEETAEAEGAIFADLRDMPGVLDHTACAPLDQQWIRALAVPGDGSDFHPSSAGMRAMADQVLRTVGVDVPDPDPQPQPEKTRAQIRKELRRALESTRLVSHCRWSGPTRPRHRLVRMRVRGGKGLVDQVEFRLGKRLLTTKKKAPYQVHRRAKLLRRMGERVNWRNHRRMHAKVTVALSGEKIRRGLWVKRPRCLR